MRAGSGLCHAPSPAAAGREEDQEAKGGLRPEHGASWESVTTAGLTLATELSQGDKHRPLGRKESQEAGEPLLSAGIVVLGGLNSQLDRLMTEQVCTTSPEVPSQL